MASMSIRRCSIRTGTSVSSTPMAARSILRAYRRWARPYRARMRLAGKIKAALKDAQGRERELAEIERQLAEIDAAKLRPGEEEELESRAAILENAENIRAALSQAYQLTYDGAGSAQELLSRAAVAVEKIAGIDARYAALSDRLREVFIAAQDAGYEVRDALEDVEATPRRWKDQRPAGCPSPP